MITYMCFFCQGLFSYFFIFPGIFLHKIVVLPSERADFFFFIKNPATYRPLKTGIHSPAPNEDEGVYFSFYELSCCKNARVSVLIFSLYQIVAELEIGTFARYAQSYIAVRLFESICLHKLIELKLVNYLIVMNENHSEITRLYP